MFETVKRSVSHAMSRLCLASSICPHWSLLSDARGTGCFPSLFPLPTSSPVPLASPKSHLPSNPGLRVCSQRNQTKAYHTNPMMTPTAATLFTTTQWAYRDPLTCTPPSPGFPHTGASGKDAGTSAQGAAVWIWEQRHSPSTCGGLSRHNELPHAAAVTRKRAGYADQKWDTKRVKENLLVSLLPLPPPVLAQLTSASHVGGLK